MRSLTTELSTALVAPNVPAVYLVAVFFDSVTVAWNSGPSDISYGGHTYVAAGNLGSVAPIGEEPGVQAAMVAVMISGIKPELTALLMGSQYLGRAVTIHYAILDDQNRFDSTRCIQVFGGTIDSISGTQGKTASYTINVASRLSDWERNRTLTYNDADQQRLYPGDKGMEYVAQLSTMKIIWPQAKFLPTGY